MLLDPDPDRALLPHIALTPGIAGDVGGSSGGNGDDCGDAVGVCVGASVGDVNAVGDGVGVDETVIGEADAFSSE